MATIAFPSQIYKFHPYNPNPILYAIPKQTTGMAVGAMSVVYLRVVGRNQ